MQAGQAISHYVWVPWVPCTNHHQSHVSVGHPTLPGSMNDSVHKEEAAPCSQYVQSHQAIYHDEDVHNLGSPLRRVLETKPQKTGISPAGWKVHLPSKITQRSSLFNCRGSLLLLSCKDRTAERSHLSQFRLLPHPSPARVRRVSDAHPKP